MIDDREMIVEFVDESSEMLGSIQNDLMDLMKKPDAESINRIFRAFHSMKGNSRMFGYDRLGNFAHKAEDVLSLIRKGDLAIERTTIDCLLHALDMMTLILTDIRAGGDDSRDATVAFAELESVLNANAGSGKVVSDTARAESIKQELKTHPSDKSGDDRPKTAAKEVNAPDSFVTQSPAARKGIELDLTESAPEPQSPVQTIRSIPVVKPVFVPAGLQPGHPLKILVVEDDFTSRTILMQFFSEYGVCHIAKDGLEAIRAFTNTYELNPPEPYDLICMDIMMPNMDGTQAARTIREIERGKGVEGTEYETAIIIASSVSDPATIIRACYECGANYYFVKPLSFSQMKQQMRKLNLIR